MTARVKTAQDPTEMTCTPKVWKAFTTKTASVNVSYLGRNESINAKSAFVLFPRIHMRPFGMSRQIFLTSNATNQSSQGNKRKLNEERTDVHLLAQDCRAAYVMAADLAAGKSEAAHDGLHGLRQPTLDILVVDPLVRNPITPTTETGPQLYATLLLGTSERAVAIVLALGRLFNSARVIWPRTVIAGCGLANNLERGPKITFPHCVLKISDATPPFQLEPTRVHNKHTRIKVLLENQSTPQAPLLRHPHLLRPVVVWNSSMVTDIGADLAPALVPEHRNGAKEKRLVTCKRARLSLHVCVWNVL
eukprot:CAMPEP_0179022296 /NCGR_PEP_ID=MMETSP0796-20121207/6334_1 /TAXON_ID=73915 /ORGANISM="Pyrodinium bahamense, Strain pbaha01" /LENGTH=304 /DNA_ID=CAMNT_0020718157 /DNA_START=191 /DNA_END=1103 /DNA_ORIENTATION=+